MEDASSWAFLSPPGTYTLAPAAWLFMKDMLDGLPTHAPGETFVAAWLWCFETMHKEPGSDEWVQDGAKLTLGVYSHDEVPSSVVQTMRGVPFIVHVPADILAKTPIIDVEEIGKRRRIFLR